MVRKLKEGDVFYWVNKIKEIIIDKVGIKEDIWVDEDGFLHNENNKPAWIGYSSALKLEEEILVKGFSSHGYRGNIFGPAIIRYKNRVEDVDYFIDGLEYNKQDWEEKTYVERNRILMLEEI